MHAALDAFQADNEAKIKAKRQSVLVVDGKTVKADLLAEAGAWNSSGKMPMWR